MSSNQISSKPTEKNFAPSLEDVRTWSEAGKTERGSVIYPCGCGIKLDLEEVVYPTLQSLNLPISGLGKRSDAPCFKGRLLFMKRDFHNIKPSDSHTSISTPRPSNTSTQVIAGLLSLEKLFYKSPEKAKSLFKNAVTSLVNSAIESTNRDGASLHFSKGHTIESGGSFAALDYFELVETDQEIATYINHDSIVTADSLLRPESRLSVRISLCNALNDLFVSGATKHIRIFPVLSGSDEQIATMKKEIDLAVKEYQELGADIQLGEARYSKRIPFAEGPLIGATVIGEGPLNFQAFQHLRPGDLIFVTRHLGDLSVLALNRALWLDGKEADAELVELRRHVLRNMATPQFLVGDILRKYASGEISFATDLSGPGLSVLFEAARASGVDAYIKRIKMHDENRLGHYRRNHTSGTNGPALIACRPEAAPNLLNDLREVGCSEVWQLGHVGQTSSSPAVILDESLRRLCRPDNPRLDFFSPEVEFTKEKRRIPIFQNYRFENLD